MSKVDLDALQQRWDEHPNDPYIAARVPAVISELREARELAAHASRVCDALESEDAREFGEIRQAIRAGNSLRVALAAYDAVAEVVA